MRHLLRVLTLNMCSEYPGRKNTLLKKWIDILSGIEADILFLQEMDLYNVERLAVELGLKILTIDQFDGTCVLINPVKLIIVDNHVVKLANSRKEPFYIGGMHLDDVPSVAHHMEHKLYKSKETIPIHYDLARILKLCVERRSPRVREELAKSKKHKKAIIAGDFNEPSHLDLEINVPVSRLFEKHGFCDTYWAANKGNTNPDKGHTWPASSLYKREPGQRIDMIYTKNMKILRSFIYAGENTVKWISDHKMVISDVEI
jgi:endonuclease/exonuclease/phosphatase family metal-dependent hydrolase